MRNPPTAIASAQATPAPRTGFKRNCLRLALADLVPLKPIRPAVKGSLKYLQILASVREIGIVEPPAVIPSPVDATKYLIVDGHLRVEALKDLGAADLDCLVATEDDTYSYNKRINKLSAVQDHLMIVRAMEIGVSAERLGICLGVVPETIRQRFRLLNGICAEAVELLAEKICPRKVFDILRQMKPIRQIEAAELMVSNKSYSTMFANALLAGTPTSQLASTAKVGLGDQATADSMARMERELAALQMQAKIAEESYGPDILHLTIVRGYIGKLLDNARIIGWFAKCQPEYLQEFLKIAEMPNLGSAGKAAA